ncbi:MAG: enoyl-CoA hydratase/isomerase family protein [Planctomycetes bacterium]|nr:enoyl-CoA hydratase/isomerase family protein [Planctomycetota bacterium]
MSTYETLLVDKREGWAEITVNRPEVLNAINLQVVTDLGRALDDLSRDPDVFGLIFTGAGEKAFVAGADISELVQRKRDDALRAINAGIFQRVEDFPWPTIAAIRGYALGGGCELALAMDIRLGGESAQMGQPEVNLGIIPGAGGPHRLTRLVGPGMARELIYTGKVIGAEEALRIGLLNHVHPDDRVLDEARDMMRTIMKKSRSAVRVAKLALNAAVNTVDRRSQMVEILGQGLLFDSEDQVERMTRFLERKRKKDEEQRKG